MRRFPLKLMSGFLAVWFLLATGCDGGSDDDHARPGFSPTVAAGKLQAVLDRAVAQPTIVNAVLRGASPDPAFIWENAVGVANPASGERMRVTSQFRVASVTKMVTATVVLQLVEEGFFTLDTPIGALLGQNLLPDGFTLADLHGFGGQRYGASITVRQLLNHTSGMKDYVFDRIATDGGEAPSLFERYLLDILGSEVTGISRTQWSGPALLAYYLESGLARQALFPPGQGFHYSDTNYLLLGLLIERVTATPLALQYRSRVFEPLGLRQTYLEWYEPAIEAGPAHHFINLDALGVSGGGNADLIALGINTSLDWAGGGLVSTVGDLDVFMHALFTGRLFRDPATRAAMTEWVDDGEGQSYGLGLRRRITASGLEVWGHEGVWGVAAAYLPRNGARLVVAVNQLTADPNALVDEALQGLIEADLFAADGSQ
jgi:D-alanyl-D-alanine carboxypeptidase